MSGRERWFALALRAYPRRYRTERGPEILTTLVESTETAGWVSIVADGLDLVAHGLQRRMGLGPDRFAGRVLWLASLPGLVVAAAFSAVMLRYGELQPLEGRPFLPLVTNPQFGPFHTVVAVVYLVWIVGALAALARPRWQRWIGITCVTVTALAIPISPVVFAPRPSLQILVLLLGLGLPAVLAPLSERRVRTERWAAVAVGMVTLVALWYASWSWDGPALSNLLFAASIFRYGPWLPYGVLCGMGLGVGLVVAGRSTWVSAGVLVVAPWLVVAGDNFGRPSLSSSGFDVVLLVLIALWLLGNWAWDLHRGSRSAGSMVRDPGLPG